MKDPSRRSTSPSIISEDMIMNGHSHEDDNPFAEYMWMENEEEFNRQIEEELWEEEFIERCFQEMLEEEEEIFRKRWIKFKTSLMILLSVTVRHWKIWCLKN
uniref:Ataxin-2 C-terminal domain-containing protein n=1 Tax=Micrurus spixii TaxID=129469 RepID=A0A2D4L7K7_9SAUR